MTWRPDGRLHPGISYERAELYGKPGIGAHYTRFDAKSYRLDDMARCCICGAMASNTHHWPPLGLGGGGRQFTLRTGVGQFVLLPSLFAVCGHGNLLGCHKAWHDGHVRAYWVWDSDEDAAAWWDGSMLAHSKTGPWLFNHGRYRLEDRRIGAEWEYRGDT